MPFFLNIVIVDQNTAVRHALEEKEGKIISKMPFLNTVATSLVSEDRFR